MQSIMSSCRWSLRRCSLLFSAAAAAILLMKPSSASSADVLPWRCQLMVEYSTDYMFGDNNAYRLVPTAPTGDGRFEIRVPGSIHSMLWVNEGAEWGDPSIFWFEGSWYFGHLPQLYDPWTASSINACGYVLGKVIPPSGVTFTGHETCFEDDSVIEREPEPYWVHRYGGEYCLDFMRENSVEFSTPPMSAPGRILQIHTPLGMTCRSVPRRTNALDKNNELTLTPTNPTSLRDCVDYADKHADANLITVISWDYKTRQCTAIKNEVYDECTPSTSDGSGVISCVPKCTFVVGFPYDSQNRTIEDGFSGTKGENVHLFAEGTSDQLIEMEQVASGISFSDCENEVAKKRPEAKGVAHDSSYRCYAVPDAFGGVRIAQNWLSWCMRPKATTPSNCATSSRATSLTTIPPASALRGQSSHQSELHGN